MNTILIVEDDQGIQDYLKEFLLENGFSTQTAMDGTTALQLLKKTQPDLVILDLGLPNITGDAVIREVKKKYPDLPVIILTAKDTTSDIVNGLNLGAEDYVTKPFHAEELLARIKARLRYTDEIELKVGDLIMNTKTFEVRRAGKLIQMSPHEFNLLQYLINNKERVLTREMILNRVWQYSYEVDSRVVDVYIGYLRKKIDNGYKKKLIHSVRGFGYMIKE